ncbi:ATP-binding protein [Streptomyces sp. CA-111067]|uniref:ATP-binding protein n=1 Tax=Streptomyces sp. CA-111067 TaxID=3240046 RepID=UPI003D9878E8
MSSTFQGTIPANGMPLLEPGARTERRVPDDADRVPPVVVGRWPCAPSSVPAVRRELRGVLAEWGLSELRDAAELVVSELVTNAVNAGGGGREVETRYEREPAGVRVEVADGSGVIPVMRAAGPGGGERAGALARGCHHRGALGV